MATPRFDALRANLIEHLQCAHHVNDPIAATAFRLALEALDASGLREAEERAMPEGWTPVELNGPPHEKTGCVAKVQRYWLGDAFAWEGQSLNLDGFPRIADPDDPLKSTWEEALEAAREDG